MGPEIDPTPTYTDELIRLTGYTPNDVEDHLVGEDEETVHQLGWWPQRSTHDTVQRAFCDWTASWRNHGHVHTFSVRNKVTGKLLGGCQLRKQPDGSGHVSYWTGAPYRGQGLAQRALQLLCLHAHHEAITHLEAHVSINNPASQAVAAAAGFTQQGKFDDENTIMIRYVLDSPSAATNP